jgi:hypothetical protein
MLLTGNDQLAGIFAFVATHMNKIDAGYIIVQLYFKMLSGGCLTIYRPSDYIGHRNLNMGVPVRKRDGKRTV